MKRSIGKALGVLVVVLAVSAIALPNVLHWAGLHPEYTGPQVDAPGKRALIIATNHGVLSAPGETEGPPTGVAMSELTHPYYTFLDGGMAVDVASIRGGAIAIDPQTLGYPIATEHDERYLQDSTLQAKLAASLPIADLNFADYDAIFFSGGWGAAYDLGYSELLGEKVAAAYYAQTPVIGGVCHGVLGLIKARDRDGNLLLAGRRMTGVTDKQVQELNIDITPMHPEAELRKAGAIFESRSAFRDVFATLVVVDDEQRFVTGQNQNSGLEAAHTMMALIVD